MKRPPLKDFEMTQTPNKSIGVILKGYPRLSETFIINEILLLEALGYKLHIFALRDPGEAKVHESVRCVQALVTYIPDNFWRCFFSFAIANLRVWQRHRGSYWPAFRFALRRSLCQRSSSTIKRFMQAAYLVAKGLTRVEVAHLYAHFSHGPTTVAYFVNWLTRISYSFSAHAKDIYLQEHDFLREKIWRAKFVVTCTDFNQDYLLRVAGVEAAVFRSYHGLDLQLFKPAPSRLSDNSCPAILSVGRFVPKKGFPVLLQALHRLKQDGLRFRCQIIGSGPMQREMEKLVARLNLHHCVEILPPMPQTELLDYYRRADVFALACEVEENGDRDGIPNVVVEALAMGIPVATTRVSGIPEVIEHGLHGLLVAPKDSAALAAALATLLRNPALAQRLAAAGRAKVERDFDAKHNVKKIGKLLERALTKPAPLAKASGAVATPARKPQVKKVRHSAPSLELLSSQDG
jgi:glycosyltransferase involved in cell wall biosynthesis